MNQNCDETETFQTQKRPGQIRVTFRFCIRNVLEKKARPSDEWVAAKNAAAAGGKNRRAERGTQMRSCAERAAVTAAIKDAERAGLAAQNAGAAAETAAFAAIAAFREAVATAIFANGETAAKKAAEARVAALHARDAAARARDAADIAERLADEIPADFDEGPEDEELFEEAIGTHARAHGAVDYARNAAHAAELAARYPA